MDIILRSGVLKQLRAAAVVVVNAPISGKDNSFQSRKQCFNPTSSSIAAVTMLIVSLYARKKLEIHFEFGYGAHIALEVI